MRLFLLFMALALSSNCFSQQPQKKDTLKNSLQPYWLKYNLAQPVSHAELLCVLSNGDKVYSLPLDHMPCIVPDSSRFNYHMPVAKGKVLGTIPNGLPNEQIIPENQ